MIGVSGFVCIAVREWTAIIVLPPSSWRQATLIRVVFDFSNPNTKKNPEPAKADSGFLVGVSGFEPEASWSRTKRDTKLRHTPLPGYYMQKDSACQEEKHEFSDLCIK